MISKEVKEWAEKIGQFYLEKHNGNYEAAETEITRLHISKIEEDNGAIKVFTPYPGILIGKRGTNIEALIEYMGINVKIIEDMDCLHEYLVPQPEDDYFDYDMSAYDDFPEEGYSEKESPDMSGCDDFPQPHPDSNLN